MTYSMVARDDVSGELGVVVQSCMFAVGSVVPWARPGVGAVATQAIAEPAYGPRCLDALVAGRTASEALSDAQSNDPMIGLRQVAVVSTGGSVAAVTGDLCIDHARHVGGDGFVAAANMGATPEVAASMASAFVSTSGPLARRLLAALTAGEDAGGDARGRMSAALLVVDGTAPSEHTAGIVVDLRIDRSDDPIGDLSDLLDAADAYAAFENAVEQLSLGEPMVALTRLDNAVRILPDDANLRFARSGALLAVNDVEAAATELRALIAERPTWETIIRSFVAKGFIKVPAYTSIDALLNATP